MDVFIHSLIHSNDDWTRDCVPAYARSWGYGGDYGTALGLPSLPRVDKDGGKRGKRAE